MVEAFNNGDYDNPILTNIFDELEIEISELGLDRELSENELDIFRENYLVNLFSKEL